MECKKLDKSTNNPNIAHKNMGKMKMCIKNLVKHQLWKYEAFCENK